MTGISADGPGLSKPSSSNSKTAASSLRASSKTSFRRRPTQRASKNSLPELVKQNHLTKFQAQHVNAGKTKSLILGNYTILDKIGAGGMGQVFKAEHRRMERVVAIKMLPPADDQGCCGSGSLSARSRGGRQAAAIRISSPPTMPTRPTVSTSSSWNTSKAKTSRRLVKKDGPFSVAKAVNYILQAARGLGVRSQRRASCIETSSPPTCCSTKRHGQDSVRSMSITTSPPNLAVL